MRPLPSSCVRIGYEERKGVFIMYGGCNPYGGGFGGGCGGYEPEKASYGGSTFVLIVVLFILLIIVGRSFCV